MIPIRIDKNIFKSLDSFGIRLQKLALETETVPNSVWQRINSIVHKDVVAGYKEQVQQRTNTKSTIESKKKHVGKSLRRGSGGETATGKRAYVSRYGYQTGYFIKALSEQIQIGNSTSFGERLVTNSLTVGNGFYIYNFNLGAFYREYPQFILNAVVSVGRRGGLISLDMPAIQMIHQILARNWFLAAIKRSLKKLD